MGRNFAHYELEEALGSGAMGHVWRAIDTRLGRPVALKRLIEASAGRADARSRFLRESRAASALNHPNIVTVFEAGEHEGEPFIAMELIEGKTLRECIGPTLGRDRVFEIARQMLAGLSVAHAAGIVHRDIKPENVMLRHDGYVKILDFGLAAMLAADRVTQTQAVLGTPLYMSPEQAMGQPLDARTDVYSSAAVLYEMLGGRTPHSGANLYEIIAHLIEEDAVPLPGVSQDLNALLLRALHRDPNQRFADAGAMLEALRRATHDREHRSRPAPDLGETVAVADARLPVERASLLVLPFACADADRDVADGVTEELIASLESIEGLRVVARNTAMRYRGQEVDARDAGRELNVGMVLEGSLRRSAQRVRVTAGLIESRSGFVLRSERVESRHQDIFDLQDEIVAALMAALREHFSTLALLRRGGPAALKTEANERFAQAVPKLDKLTPENVLAAVELLSEAVRLQPDFAPAQARLAQALVHKLNFFPPADASRLLEQARACATEALKIDPTSADAHFALGFVQMARVTQDLRAARRHMRHALSLSPNHVPSLSWMAYLQTLLGNASDGEAFARRAIARDPQGINHFVWLAFALASRGDFEEAADAAERGLRMNTESSIVQGVLLMLDLWRGRDTDAAQYARFLEGEGGAYPLLRAAQLVYLARTQHQRWEEMRPQDRAIVAEHVISARIAASVPALSGDAETTVRLLRQARAIGDRNLPFLDVDPFLEKVRESILFQQFRAEIADEIASDAEQ